MIDAGSDGYSVNWTDCDDVSYRGSGMPWTNYRRHWMRHTSAHYWTLTRKIGCMLIVCFNALSSHTVPFKSKSWRSFSRSRSRKEERQYSKQIAALQTQETWCSLHALV